MKIYRNVQKKNVKELYMYHLCHYFYTDNKNLGQVLFHSHIKISFNTKPFFRATGGRVKNSIIFIYRKKNIQILYITRATVLADMGDAALLYILYRRYNFRDVIDDVAVTPTMRG